jgi:hypothetical protein
VKIDVIRGAAVFLSESRSRGGREGDNAISGAAQHKMIASRNTLPRAATNRDVPAVKYWRVCRLMQVLAPS